MSINQQPKRYKPFSQLQCWTVAGNDIEDLRVPWTGSSRLLPSYQLSGTQMKNRVNDVVQNSCRCDHWLSCLEPSFQLNIIIHGPLAGTQMDWARFNVPLDTFLGHFGDEGWYIHRSAKILYCRAGSVVYTRHNMNCNWTFKMATAELPTETGPWGFSFTVSQWKKKLRSSMLHLEGYSMERSN